MVVEQMPRLLQEEQGSNYTWYRGTMKVSFAQFKAKII
jgi:hypothetical protein